MDYEQVESSQRQHHEILLHQEKMCVAVESTEYNKFSILKPKLYMDGNEWCVLFGDNIQEGVAGFGKTPDKAVLDWNRQWFKEVEPPTVK